MSRCHDRLSEALWWGPWSLEEHFGKHRNEKPWGSEQEYSESSIETFGASIACREYLWVEQGRRCIAHVDAQFLHTSAIETSGEIQTHYKLHALSGDTPQEVMEAKYQRLRHLGKVQEMRGSSGS